MQRIIGLIFGVTLIAACSEAETESTSSAVETAESTAVVNSVVEGAEEAVAAVAEVAQDAGAREGVWGDIVYGDPNAPIEIIEYASMTCPHCASFSSSIFPKVKEKYIDTGKVKFLFRNLVTNQVDLAASTVARCSNQEVAQKLTKEFFAKQNDWGRSQDPISALAGIARKAGISRTQFDRCLANTEMHKNLVKIGQDGVKEFNVTATPTIIVNGSKLDNYAFETIEKAVDAAL
ncbi:thioredoxin domain-containing protein [Kordiimonas sp. SCSIO 12610]|uniref:thioredoxin domain-containing protein n=1 Tax=Kordiimonas sp. SCSIO 12610 TaxID=2829597 RepID=UPI00210BE425|nr:thioredoxin domain-containing protein [Kordiimonas sp. SCSIO 12610]UTW54499.1 DsbA family protein [Kordiimonas sp. SCSIO 12610]